VVTICAAFVAFIGIVTIILGIWAVYSSSLHVVDQIVRIDSASSEGSIPTFTTKRVYEILMGIGGATFIGACVGIFGHKERKKPAISCYLIFTVIVAFIMLLATLQLWQRMETVGPIVNRQVEVYCDRTIYNRQFINLGCTNQSKNVQKLACGKVCVQRQEILNKNNACKLLRDMCDMFEYQQSEIAGHCVFQVTNSYTSQQDIAGCEASCNSFNWCTGYVALKSRAIGNCVMNSSHPPPNETVVWTNMVLPDLHTNEAQYGCYTKGTPYVLPRFNSFAKRGVLIALILSISLIVSMVCTCYNLYNVNISRSGKMGCGALFLTIFCPCAAPPPDDHLGNLVEDGAE